MFQRIVSIADKAYSDLNIPLGCSSGFNVDVFGNISEQVRMVKEAQSHLFKPSKDDRSAHEYVTADTALAENRESERQQIDDKCHGEHVEAVKTEHRSSTQRPPSRVDKSKSQKIQDRPRTNRIYNHPNAIKSDEQEVKRASKEESLTVMSAQKLSKSKTSREKQRSEAVSRSEHDTKSGMSKPEKQKYGTTNDVQQQLVVKKPTAAKVKSVIVKPADDAQNHRNSPAHNSGCRKNSDPNSDDDVSRRVVSSFHEVHQICLFYVILIHRIAIVVGTLHCLMHSQSAECLLLSL